MLKYETGINQVKIDAEKTKKKQRENV